MATATWMDPAPTHLSGDVFRVSTGFCIEVKPAPKAWRQDEALFVLVRIGKDVLRTLVEQGEGGSALLMVLHGFEELVAPFDETKIEFDAQLDLELMALERAFALLDESQREAWEALPPEDHPKHMAWLGSASSEGELERRIHELANTLSEEAEKPRAKKAAPKKKKAAAKKKPAPKKKVAAKKAAPKKAAPKKKAPARRR